MIRIYLDNCCFNRPFDDMGNINIRLESIAKLHIQNLIRNEKLELAWSYLLESENDQNPFLDKKISIAAWKDISTINIEESEELLLKSEEYSNLGIKPLDSIHIVCAYFMNCHYFLTTDKGILNKSQYVRDIQILNPIEFLNQLEEQ
ncbi:MAG: PIN domain protein [Leptospiraceae bacterium]|nr:PIN domain protein [Leptospiraceae bacterium]